MASKVQLELDHSRMKQGFHEGLSMPECYESIEEHLPKVKAMEIRSDDVLLCSYPKSGTHWIYRVIDMLQRGHAIYDKRTADSTFVDLQQIERLSELDSPRLLVTHLPFDRLPQQVTEKRTKIVHVYRNPRAVLVSLYHHWKALEGVTAIGKSELTLDKMGNNFLSNEMIYTGWFNYLDKVSDFLRNNPDHPVFNVSYEEMTLNAQNTVMALAKFLDKPATPDLCKSIVEACSFKNQKETEEKANKSQETLKFYRKGDMDDWKNHITVALDEKFNSILKKRASSGCQFSAKY